MKTFTVDMPGVLDDYVAGGIEQDGGPAWAAYKAAKTVPCGRGYLLRITGTAADLDRVTVRVEALLGMAGTGEVSASELRAARVWLERLKKAGAS